MRILQAIVMLAALSMTTMWVCAASLPSAQTGSSKTSVVKMTPGMTVSSLAQRSDSDVVEFSSGRRLPIRDIRRLDAVAKKLQAGARPLPTAFSVKPGATVATVKSRDDLLAALQRPDTDTVRLPSGKLITAAQLRLLKPEVEKRLGRSMESVPTRRTPTGPTMKLQHTVPVLEWKSILTQPDNTVLESPNGKKITVGELKQVLTMGRTDFKAQTGTVKGGRK